MAVTWSVKITVLDVAQRHVSVTATRTDSADAANPKSYTVPSAHIDTVGQRTAVMDAIWTMRQADVAVAAKMAAFAPTVTALETAAKTNLEAREA